MECQWMGAALLSTLIVATSGQVEAVCHAEVNPGFSPRTKNENAERPLDMTLRYTFLARAGVITARMDVG